MKKSSTVMFLIRVAHLFPNGLPEDLMIFGDDYRKMFDKQRWSLPAAWQKWLWE